VWGGGGGYWFVLQKNYNYIYIGLHKLAQKYKTSILGFFLGSLPAVVVHDYDSIRQVLTRPEFQDRVRITVIDRRTYNKNLGEFSRQGKGKTIPLYVWTGPEISRWLSLPDFKTVGT
jgi:hypothetical protein